jgi:5'(3')-deoxyribonucleotidase
MIIGVDVDQTILDLTPSWISLYNRDFSDDLKVEDITRWKISDFVVNEAKDAIYDYIKFPEVFEMSKPIDGAIHAISYLKSLGHRIVYVTINNPDNVKNRWLKKYGFMEHSSDLVIAEDKSLINLNFLVDDKPENVQETCGVGILFSRLHNQNFEWYPRASTWVEVIGIIEGWGE